MQLSLKQVELYSIHSGTKAVIRAIQGDDLFKTFLLSHGLKVDSEFIFNYSPSISKLINISIGGKMIGLSVRDFNCIEFEILDS